MKVKQCTIQSKQQVEVVWLESRPDLEEGNWITLKDSDDPKRNWRVEQIFGLEQEKSDVTGKKWNNNI